MENNEISEEKNSIKVDNVKVEVSFRIGTKRLSISDLKKIKEGEILPLEAHINDPVIMLVNGQPKAVGEVCEDDGKFVYSIQRILN